MAARIDRFSLRDGSEVAVLDRAGHPLREALAVEVTLPPLTPAPPACLHPRHVVELTVLGGFVEVRVGREWSVLGTGEAVVVAAGTPYAYRNQAREPARLHAVHSPAEGYQEYLGRLARLAGDGRLDRMRLALLRREHADAIRLADARARGADALRARVARLVGVRLPPAD